MKSTSAWLVTAGLVLVTEPLSVSAGEPGRGGGIPGVAAPVSVIPAETTRSSAAATPESDRLRNEITRAVTQGPTPEIWELLAQQEPSKYLTIRKQQNDILNPLFRQWGRESPQAAMRYLATNPAIFSGLKRGLMDEILAGWAMNAPEEAWEAARNAHISGTSMRPLVVIGAVLAEAKRFELVAGLMVKTDRTGLGGDMGMVARDLAAAWWGADPQAASKWVETLSGIDLTNAKFGLALAQVKKDSAALKAQLGRMEAREAAMTALALTSNLPPADAARLLASLPSADDGRYADAIMMHFMTLLMATQRNAMLGNGVELEYAEKEIASDLISKVSRERHPRVVEGYVMTVGMKAPTDALWVARRFLTPEETRNVFVKLMIRAQTGGQSRDEISKQWAALDPEFRKSLGF